MPGSRKIKIAIIGAKGYPIVYGGYDTFVKELSERLSSRGIEVTVYCHRKLFKSKPKMLNGIKLVYTPAIETKSLSQLSHSLLSFVHACFSRVHIILAVNPANGPFGLLTKMAGKKSLINMDGLEWLRPKWKGLGSKYFLFSSRLATKLYDIIVNDSKVMREVYLEKFKTDSRVIAYGANIRYSKNPDLIEKWDLRQMGYFLVVGRMIPDNNVDLILQAFMKSKVNKKLVVVGDAPFNDKFAKYIKEIGKVDPRVLFTGYVFDQNELAELYHNSYLYIHGHEFGGTNPAMLKAMAYGCAILALETPFNREMLAGDNYGLYFPKDEDGLKNKMEELEAKAPQLEQLRSRSREGIKERYNWDLVTDQYEELLKELLETG